MLNRYSSEEMAHIWSDVEKYRRWRDVELAVIDALAQFGFVPQEAADECKARAGDFTDDDIKEIELIEAFAKHDVIAFITFMENRIGDSARYLHYGLTSSDIVDTALSMGVVKSLSIIVDQINALQRAMLKLANEHKYTYITGRTHGIHAEPTSFGHKILVFAKELERCESRVVNALLRAGVAKLSGAVGTFAHTNLDVEHYAASTLGLRPSIVSNQVMQRDIHAEVITSLAILGGCLESIAIEIRHLSRTEVGEVAESFGPDQKGSSAMPHKRNPISSENISGLARLLRGYASTAMDNMALWHERDISHSSVERVIIPDSMCIADYMLRRMCGVIENLAVDKNTMAGNMLKTRGLIYSQRLMLMLVRKGLLRQDAYALVQAASNKVRGNPDIGLYTAAINHGSIAAILSGDEIKSCFDDSFYIRHMDEVFDLALQTMPR